MGERKHLTRALTAHSKETLQALADRLTAGCSVAHVRLPSAGLGLLALSDGAFHESFNLGEFPLSTCQLELSYPDGRRAEGGAQVMADDVDLASALAVLDAVLAARAPGWEDVQELAACGAQRRREQDRRRRALLVTTKVDFARLAEAQDDDDA